MGAQNFGHQASYGGRSYPARGGQGFQGGRQDKMSPEPVTALPLPKDYLDQAEELMRTGVKLITTSKIRRLLSLVTKVYNEEILRNETELSADSLAAVGMMRIRFAYECGRDSKVKNFVESARLMNYLKGIGNSRESFIQFAQYMEALVAYHKFFGGKEN